MSFLPLSKVSNRPVENFDQKNKNAHEYPSDDASGCNRAKEIAQPILDFSFRVEMLRLQEKRGAVNSRAEDCNNENSHRSDQDADASDENHRQYRAELHHEPLNGGVSQQDE